MRTLWGWAVVAAGIAACDAQRGPDYEGKPLLTIQGSITRVDGERLDSDLVPAIAWEDEWGGGLFLQDVHAEGDFPASFRLSILQPPPAEAIFESIDALRMGFGSIIAARPGHPARAEGHAFETAFGPVCPPDQACPRTRSWCASEERCYVEEVICEPGQTGDACRVVHTQGDPALRQSAWEEHVEGFSENYFVFYAAQRMPANSAAAGYYNDWKAIEPGMYLVEVKEPDDSNQAAREACEAAGYQRAVQWFNAEYGTSFASYEDFSAADLSTDQYNEVEREFLRYAGEVKCPISDGAERLVPRTDNRPIAIVIGKRVSGGEL